MNKIINWSYSKYKDYTQCPAKVKFKYIDKIPEVTTASLVKGTSWHSNIEGYIKGYTNALNPEIKNFLWLFDSLRALNKRSPDKVFVEEQWCFTKDWGNCDWLSKDAWLRVKLDCATMSRTTMEVMDWKTGKYSVSNHSDYDLQMSLYALAVFLRFPDIEEVIATLHFLSGQEITYPKNSAKVYYRHQLDDLKSQWETNISSLLLDDTFATKPNQGCQWCGYSSSNGGECKF